MSSSYRSSRLGLSHWDPYTVHRGGCLELYYCNMVEWFWCDSSLILTTNWFPSVLWHIVGLVIWPVKIVPKMTYTVLRLYTTTCFNPAFGCQSAINICLLFCIDQYMPFFLCWFIFATYGAYINMFDINSNIVYIITCSMHIFNISGTPNWSCVYWLNHMAVIC